MARRTPRTTAGHGLRLDPDAVDAMRAELPEVAEHVVAAIIDEVPSYTDAFSGPMGETIRNAVQLALGGFLSLASGRRGADPRTPAAPAVEGAYQLGRGEARSGRTTEALLAAYRIGARVSWRQLSTTAVANGMPPETLASFAELVFAYIDELSAASVAGPHRRAGHHRPGPPAAARADRPPPADRRAGGHRRHRGRAGRLGAADHAHRGDRAGGPGAPGAVRAVAAHPAGRRPARPRRGRAAAGARRPRPASRGAAARDRRPRLRRRPAAAVAGGARVVRPGAAGAVARPRPATPRPTCPSWCCGPTPPRWPTCAPRPSRRWRPAPGLGREARRHPARVAAAPRPARRDRGARSSCTRRPCATGWASSGSCTATGSTTPKRS